MHPRTSVGTSFSARNMVFSFENRFETASRPLKDDSRAYVGADGHMRDPGN